MEFYELIWTDMLVDEILERSYGAVPVDVATRAAKDLLSRYDQIPRWFNMRTWADNVCVKYYQTVIYLPGKVCREPEPRYLEKVVELDDNDDDIIEMIRGANWFNELSPKQRARAERVLSEYEQDKESRRNE